MLSRLSGLANTVLHELSGDGDDGDPGATDTGLGTAPIPGIGEDASEDVLERLAQTEQLVVHLKTMIREKDAQLQQKDATLKEERDLSDVKLAKLKLQAKAKMASLNKQIEELKKPTLAPGSLTKSAAKESQELSIGQGVCEDHGAELEALKSHLLENDRTVQTLQETISGLKEQLDSAKDLESKQAEQLHFLQEKINAKDSHLQELMLKHEEELKQLAARSDLCLQEQLQQLEAVQQQLTERSDAGADMQQALKTLQRKHEEQEEALLGRARVVEMLQQELQNADQQKQILSEQLRDMQAELNSVKVELDSEKQAFKTISEQLEGELTNKETLIVSLRGDLQGLATELQQVRQSQAELELQGNSRDEMHRQEVQNLTEVLEQARRTEEVLRLQDHPSKEAHAQEVKGLMQALEQARQDHARLELQGSSRDEQLRAEVQSLKEALEQQKRDHAELELQGTSKDLTHRAEVQSLKDALEQAMSTLTNQELEKSIWDAKQKETPSLTGTSEQSEIVQVESSVCMMDEMDRPDSLIPQLLTRQEELLVACSALEVRKKELVQEIDLQSAQCKDLNLKIHSLQALLISSQGSQETSTAPLLTSDDEIQPPRDEKVTVCESLATTEAEREIILTKTAELKSKELSILMLDLKDAHEELSKMKNELPEIEGVLDGSVSQEFQVQRSICEDATTQLTMKGMINLEAMLHSETQRVEQTIVKEQSVSIFEIPAVKQFTEVPDQEWQKLQIEVCHLKEAENTYKRELEERDAQIKQLKELVMEQSEKTGENDNSSNPEMKVEKEQPAQILGITEHLGRLQWNLADAEKERLSDYESSTMQQSLMGEQISSLENESKSKDLKIEALQKDLDQLQLQLCGQISVVKQLGAQLQAKEEEVSNYETRLQDSLNKLEVKSELISMKELEAAATEQLLFQNVKDIESLREAVAEKELQAAEISHSMSEKMVLLNEEKFSLMNDLKALKKQLEPLNESENVPDQFVKSVGDPEDMSLKSPEHMELLKVVAQLQQEKGELEIHLESMKHEKLQLLQECDELQDQLEILRSNQPDINKRAEVAQSTEKNLDQEEHQRLTEGTTSLESKIEKSQVQIQSSKAGQLHVSKMDDTQVGERDEHQEQLESLQYGQLLQQEELVRAYKVEMEELQVRLEALTSSSLQQDQQLATLQRENGDLLRQLETLKSQPCLLQDGVIETLKMEKEQLQVQLETLKSEHLCQGEVVEALQEVNKSQLSQQEVLRPEEHVETIEVLKRENEELQIQLETLKKDILQQDGLMEILKQEKAEQLDHLEKLSPEHLGQDEQIVSVDHKTETTGSDQFKNAACLEGNDMLQIQLKEQKKENEQMKRKLQAALLNRKELMKKIGVLEKEIMLLGVQARGEELIKGVMEEDVVTNSQNETTLIQQLSEKEIELQNAKQCLLEKAADEEKLQALIKDVTFELQDKTCLIESLQVELIQNQSIIQKLTTITDEQAIAETATDPDPAIVALGPAQDLQTSILESKISSLEQEKEQLQKKVQETLASRKNTIKKAQEKDRHHREQLKQQKEEYNLLQEKFDEQNQHQVNIQAQLLELQKELEVCRLSHSQTDAAAVLQVSSEETINMSQISLQDSVWGHEWVEFTSSEVEDTLNQENRYQGESQLTDQYSLELEMAKTKKTALQDQLANVEYELSQKSGEVQRLQDQIVLLISDLESSNLSHREAQGTISHLKLELGNCQEEILRLEELRNLQPQIEELKMLLSLQNDEKDRAGLLLGEKDKALASLQNIVLEKEDLVKALQTQIENLSKDYEEKSKRLQTEVLEIQQKQEEDAEESKSKQQVQRKLQAALISRKEALKESKALKEQLSTARNNIDELTRKLTIMERDLSNVIAEKGNILQDSASLREERDKLIAEVNRLLLENQNLAASCECHKLAMEGITHEKVSLEREMDKLRNSQATESSEWQVKHKELQKEYETLLQSYENVSNETERIQRVMETVRQEKQELFNKMKVAEAQKKEMDKQLEEAEHEMDGMKEKMRKFAKSKQQKILELEEENEKLRAELQPARSEQKLTEDAFVKDSAYLKGELERLQIESATLISRLSVANDDNAALSEEVYNLKKQLQSSETDVSGSPEVEESSQQDLVQEVTVVTAAVVLPTSSFKELKEKRISEDSSVETSVPDLDQAMLKLNESGSNDEINTYIQQISKLQQQILNLEEEKCDMEDQLSQWKTDFQVLTEERKEVETQLFTSNDDIKALHKTIANLETKNTEIRAKLDKVRKERDILEAEKDDLEERLMNQLAELNGSIGNYQQDATDFRTKSDNLELQLQSFQVRISELEEVNRQLEKEKQVAESQMKKEYTEKLKSVQTGEKGRKTHAKELQELLREKQLEVKHLQKDCISYQEKISELERTVKALEFVQSESLKDLSAAKQSLAKVVEERKKAHAELDSFKVLLDDTQSETARVLAESLKLKEELQASKDSAKNQVKKKEEKLEQQMEEERQKNTKEIKNMQEKLDAIQREKDHLEETKQDLRGSLDKKNQDAKELQVSLNESLARLAAFTRSMSSLQDDRDRIIDESKKWEKKFTSSIQKKEQEIQAKEEACLVFKAEVKQMSILIEELQIKLSRLEHDVVDWESKLHSKEESHQTKQESWQLENKKLASQLENSQKLCKDCQEELAKQNEDVKILKEQLTELANDFSKSELTKEELESVAKEKESEIQNYKFSCEQLQADLQASKYLTNKLHDEIEAKDQNIMSLLAAKEEDVSAATSELLHQHSNEIKGLEDKLTAEVEEKQNLEAEQSKLQDRLKTLIAKMKTIKEQGKEHKDRLDSFTKSMSSLQDDRDRVMEEYKQLEARHLSAMLDKDQFIQEAAAENNELKEEIRSLHSGLDDLNSENAKLAAQLVRYREDLNQVITLKDSQQKQLLKAQLQQIHSLGEEKSTLEKQLRDAISTAEELQKTINDLREDKQRVANETETLQLCVSQINDELATLKCSGQLYELEVKLQDKEREVEALSSEHLVLQGRISELEDNSLHLQNETDEKVAQISEKHAKELKSLQHDAGIMRNETETATVRVVELAKDLMEMEQRYLFMMEENEDLKAQVLAFGKSMSSLQDSRDKAEGELEKLQKKYSSDLEIQEALVNELQKDLDQLRGEQSLLVMERNSLDTQLTLLKGSSVEQDLLSKIEQLNKLLMSKEAEVARLSSELDGYSTQVKSFSNAMGSLQDERDRLLSELDKQRKVEDEKQQSVPSPAQVQSMKNALSSLQDDRDRLLKELKNLQQQYLRIGEEAGDIIQLKDQLQESHQQLEVQLNVQEQLRQERSSLQQELLGLREEKMSLESHSESLKKQYLAALADKDQQLSDMQRLLQEAPSPSFKPKTIEEEYQRRALPKTNNSVSYGPVNSLEDETIQLQSQLSDSLKQLHQKELRIQQLNSKLSQIFEEKNSLSIQLRGSSQNVRDSQLRYNEVQKHCVALEAQLQAMQSQLKEPVNEKGESMTDAAPGAPQEKNDPKDEAYSTEMKEIMLRLSEARHHQMSSDQELQRLEELLSHERERRLAAEEALFSSEDQIRRLESSHWAPAQDHSHDDSAAHEHSLLIEPLESTFSKTRSNSRLKRLLQYVFYSRTRTPLLVTAYLLTVHILLLLCFTGHL